MSTRPTAPRPSTALVVDIRDFTGALLRAREQGTEGRFLRFLEAFYQECLYACEATGAAPGDGSLAVNSTGDGVLAVFLDPHRHVRQAYAAALLLYLRLPTLFQGFDYLPYKEAMDCFGMGIESGEVHIAWAQASHSTITSCVGNPINVAARLQNLTKGMFRTSLILGKEANDLLCEWLRPGFGYSGKVAGIFDHTTQVPLGQVFAELDAMNQELSLKFINHLYLQGVSEPLASFRLSPSLADDRPRLDRLIARLFTDDPPAVEGFYRCLARAPL